MVRMEVVRTSKNIGLLFLVFASRFDIRIIFENSYLSM